MEKVGKQVKQKGKTPMLKARAKDKMASSRRAAAMALATTASERGAWRRTGGVPR